MPEQEAPDVPDSAQTTPEPSVAETYYSESPTPSDNDTSSEASSENFPDTYTLCPGPGYEKIRIPMEQNLRQMLVKVTETNDLESVTKIRLRVIARDFSLNRIPHYIPNLTELNLTGSCLMSLRDLGCDMYGLQILHVTRCGLNSLDGLLGLTTIVELYAGSNNIDDLSPCAFLPEVHTLDLKSNSIKDATSVGFLALCETLKHLSLEGCPTSVIENYRTTIKRTLPTLVSLDGVEFSPEEVRPLDEPKNGTSTIVSRFPPIERPKSTNNKLSERRPLTTEATFYSKKPITLSARPVTARKATHGDFAGIIDGSELKLKDVYSYLMPIKKSTRQLLRNTGLSLGPLKKVQAWGENRPSSPK